MSSDTTQKNSAQKHTAHTHSTHTTQSSSTHAGAWHSSTTHTAYAAQQSNTHTGTHNAGTPHARSTQNMRVREHFLTVWTLVGVVLLLVALGYVLNIMALPVSIVLWTLVFVFCLAGLVDWFEKKGLSRLLGTTIAYVIMVLILIALALLMFSPAFGLNSQFTELAKSMPAYANNFMAWATSLYDSVGHLFEDDTLKQWLTDVATAVVAAITSLFEGGATGIVSIGSGVVNSVIAVGFALVIAFWILMELPAMDREARRLVGPNHSEGYDLFTITVTRVVGGFIKATLLQCLLIGVGCGVLFLILQLPSALALAGIVALLNIIPVIGPWIAVAAASIVGLVVSPITGLIIFLGVIVIQQFIYTFVSPKLMENSVDIHPILTLIVLVAGSSIGGAMGGVSGSIVGMLMAIPAVAIMKSLFVYYFEKKTGRQLVAYDGVFFQGSPSDVEHVDPMADALSPADYNKEHQLVEQERIQRTGRLERVRANDAPTVLAKIELPFKKRVSTAELPRVSAANQGACEFTAKTLGETLEAPGEIAGKTAGETLGEAPRTSREIRTKTQGEALQNSTSTPTSTGGSR